jgi:hypothetical protein
MRLLNRGYILVQHRQSYWDWVKNVDEECIFNEDDNCEPTLYLIKEDFFDDEILLEQYFKKIFKSELLSVTDNENLWPEKMDIETFELWFMISVIGSTVIDLEKSDIQY